MRVFAARRAGRSHRDRNIPCQDAYAVYRVPGAERAVAAVADGLGSRPLSHHGSQAAADAAVQSLGNSKAWGPRALHRAFRVARRAVEAKAKELGAASSDLATTLHLVGLQPGRLVAGSVGDGAVLVADRSPRVLLAPEEQEFANLVVPLTDEAWADHLRTASDADARGAFVVTDGLTRLLMRKRGGAWAPYPPFFDSVLPRLVDAGATDDWAARFLGTESVDAAWDDDKALAVVMLDG